MLDPLLLSDTGTISGGYQSRPALLPQKRKFKKFLKFASWEAKNWKRKKIGKIFRFEYFLMRLFFAMTTAPVARRLRYCIGKFHEISTFFSKNTFFGFLEYFSSNFWNLLKLFFNFLGLFGRAFTYVERKKIHSWEAFKLEKNEVFFP